MKLADPAPAPRRPVTVLLALVAALALTVSPDPASAGALPRSSDGPAVLRSGEEGGVTHLDAAWYEKRVLAEINQRRAAHHRSRLKPSHCADRLAERWGRYLAVNHEFFHQDLSPFFDRCGASYAGETLARGAVRPAKIVNLWMQSPGHRRIVLSRNPRRAGIGAHTDTYGNWVVAADFIRR